MSLKSFVKQTVIDFARISFSKRTRIQTLYAKYYQSPIVKNTILYEVRDGGSIVDSPLALFNFLIGDSRFESYHHIWVINDKDNPKAKYFKDQFPNRVSIVERNSKEYLRWLATAHYLVNNATFQGFFSKREEQVYINTWHGTPLKLMGFDIPGDLSHSHNVLRNFLMTDYILSPNSHTSHIFSQSYRLAGIYEGKILEGGYPRIDATLQNDRKVIFAELATNNLFLDVNLPTILYTPTWKGTSITEPNNDQEQIIQESLLLKNKLAGKYNFLLKVHPYLYQSLKNNPKIKDMLVPDFIDANALMAGVDLLITDYSSIFFDFLVTDQPIIFYAWDRDLYQNQRGMYLSEDTLPGPIVENIDELLLTIENLSEVSKKYQSKYNAFKIKFVPYDDGNTTEKYVNRIFFNQSQKEIKEISLTDRKKKLLIYPGRLKKNGITSSFMNLLKNIDYKKYDVSILLGKGLSNEEENVINNIPKQARLLFIPNGKLYKRSDYFRENVFKSFGKFKFLRNIYPKFSYYQDSRRIVGGVFFDAAIDFSGYSFYWARIICNMPATKKIIYQHNDLLSESEKVIDGKKVHKNNLAGVFLLYRYFDRILSVSEETMEVNRIKLAKYVKATQLGYANNLLDIDKLLNLNQTDTNDDKISENSLNFKRYTAKIKESGNYLIAKNLNNLTQNRFEKLKIFGDSRVYVVATILLNKKRYAKITVNGIYVGWIDLDLLSIKVTFEVKFKSVYQLVTISKSLDGFIYSSPAENSKKVSPLSYLDKTYVGVNRIAITEAGNYSLIQTYDGEVGWVEQKFVTNIHDMRKFSFLRNYLIRKNKIQISQEFDEKFRNGVLIGQPAVVLSDDEKKIPNVPVDIDLTNYVGHTLTITKRIVIQEKELFLTNFNSLMLWVSSDAVKLIKDVSVCSKKRNEENLQDISGNAIDNINPNNFNMITMGRFSPEKNQLNLIRAFKYLTKEHENIKLFILGEGDLKNDIQNLIRELDLQNAVYLLGHRKDPFSIMKKCDLFILPSIYEGQPMVLLEALTLGMNVIATDIPANRSVLQNKYGGYIHGTNVQSLEEGIEAYLKDKVSYAKFNAQAYNYDAIVMFYENLK